MIAVIGKNKWLQSAVIFCMTALSSVIGSNINDAMEEQRMAINISQVSPPNRATHLLPLLVLPTPSVNSTTTTTISPQNYPLNIESRDSSEPELSIDDLQRNDSIVANNSYQAIPLNIANNDLPRVVRPARNANQISPLAQKTLAFAEIAGHTAVNFLPLILACLSSESNSYASASFWQNATYTLIYLLATAYIAKNHFPEKRFSSISQVMCITNTMTSSIAAFSSWSYCETLSNNYRIINMVLNGVSGSIAFSLKLIDRRKRLYKLCLGAWRGSLFRYG